MGVSLSQQFTNSPAMNNLQIHVFENGFFQPLQTVQQPVSAINGSGASVTVGWYFTAFTSSFSSFSLLDTTKTIPDPISLNPVTSPTQATTITVTGQTGGTKDADKQIEYYVSTNSNFTEASAPGVYPTVAIRN